MKHAGPAELVDLAEGGGTPRAARHVGQCAVCQEQLRALREMIGLNEGVRDSHDARSAQGDIPEPSPLFWTHFPDRVRGALEDAVQRDPAWWTGRVTTRWAALALSAALVVGVVTGFAISRLPANGLDNSARGDTPVELTVAGGDDAGEAGGALGPWGATDEPEWALVLLMAETTGWTDPEAMELFMADATVDGAVVELSTEERLELKRLLETEIASSAAGVS